MIEDVKGFPINYNHYYTDTISKRRRKRQEAVLAECLEKNISQAELANELGMSVGFIGKVESPKYPSHYNIKHLNQLAKILDCSPQEFLPKKPLP